MSNPWADIATRSPVALVSANLAREWFGAPEKAVGQRIGGGDDNWFEIIGVVGNERDDGVNQPAPSIVYMSIGATRAWSTTGAGAAPSPPRSMAYVVRSTRAGTPGFLTELKRVAQSVNPNLPLANVRTLAEIQSVSMAQTTFAMTMLGLAASVAVLLALVGVYGVVAYIAAERTHEIGIRMALGARGGDVKRLLLRHGLTLALTGIGCGLVAAALVTPMMSAMLYGVRPLDSATYVAVSIVLTTVTLVATYLPAHRAARVQPVIALRSGD
jgi:predicted lysophospholipase L1 biosynthesis ABC-type transport system permease subunit